MAFPSAPSTGKNGKVSISFSDGTYLADTAATIQATYTYKGTTYTDRIYLLGTGKTLVNMRPAVEPVIDINGIVDGLIISPHASNDKAVTSAGTIKVLGVDTTVNADTDISLSRPANVNSCWNAIVVNTGTQAVTAVKGKDIAGATTGLLTTYGDPSSGAAGAKPLIAADEIAIGWIKLYSDSAAVVATSDIVYTDRETSDIDKEVLPNIGGVKIPTALVKMHTGAVGRSVYFTGYYLDEVLSEIGTAKSWATNPASNEVSENTFSRQISITELGAWAFSFEQLACDPKVKNAVMDREGYAAIKLEYPNGGYFQGVGTLAPTFNCAVGALNNISISGSFLDTPYFS